MVSFDATFRRPDTAGGLHVFPPHRGILRVLEPGMQAPGDLGDRPKMAQFRVRETLSRNLGPTYLMRDRFGHPEAFHEVLS